MGITRKGFAALGLGALLVGGLTACDTAGPETGVDVDVDVDDITDEEVVETDTPTDEGYDGIYDENFGDGDVYVGQTVVLSAQVNEVLHEHAISIGDAIGVEPLLVVFPDLTIEVEEGENVRVTGTVEENFIPEDAEADWSVELDDEDWVEWESRNYVVASSIETDVEFDDE